MPADHAILLYYHIIDENWLLCGGLSADGWKLEAAGKKFSTMKKCSTNDE
jgi:hypothetical protein